MLEVASKVTSLSCLRISFKNAETRSPSTMDLRPLRTAAAKDDFESMADHFDHI